MCVCTVHPAVHTVNHMYKNNKLIFNNNKEDILIVKIVNVDKIV